MRFYTLWAEMRLGQEPPYSVEQLGNNQSWFSVKEGAQIPSAAFFRRQCCMGKIYQQLSIEERTMIQTQLGMGIKPAAIAVWLNRSASTLSRELHRNGWARPQAGRGP